MGRINVLGFEIANLIAAGEVVDRPASVVKELCENSIDAGASSVTVEIRHGGTSFIRVSDNGCGIEPDDIPLTVLRHATSKIKTAEDLASIGTLGFRGEALAAIGAVCKLKMISRTADSDMGCQMTCEGGEIIDIIETGCAKGTTVIASELFYNVPARRKFLKKDASESAAVTAVMEKIALSSPKVAIKYIIDGVVRFMTSGDGDLRGTVYSVFGKEVASRMIPVDRTDGSGIRICGFIGDCDLVRANKNSENFFINGRFVKSRTAMAAIEQAYSTRIPSQKFPVCILNIMLNPATVDVNVHPSKLEVKFANERIIFEAVYYAVLNALESSTSRPELIIPGLTAGEEKREQVSFTPYVRPEKAPVKPKTDPIHAFVPVEKDEKREKKQIKIETEAPAWRFTDVKPVPKPTPPPVDEVPEEKKENVPAPAIPEEHKTASSAPAKKAETHKVPDYRIIGEAYNTYVIIELEDRILMVDKHAAHERILFDELCRRMKEKERRGQILMFPLKCRVSDAEIIALEEHLDEITSIGFAVKTDKASGEITVSEIPEEIGRDAAEEMITSLLSDLAESTGSVEATEAKYFEAKLYQASCKAAIKGGRVYDTAHIKWICDRLLTVPDETGKVIKTCPHGRPVAFEIKKTSIDRQFDRIQ